MIDAQLHAWTVDTPNYPWGPTNHATAHFQERTVSYHDLVGLMDDAGVAAALLVVPSIYGWNNAYSLEAVTAYPRRFAVVGRIDPSSPDARGRLAKLIQTPGIVGIRITAGTAGSWSGGNHDSMFAAAGELDIPVCVYPGPGKLVELEDVIRRQPKTRFVVDHLGLASPPVSVPKPPPKPFADLKRLFALAQFENVFVKLSGVPALSHETYPFRDTWHSVRRVINVFGAERVMWGTDGTRTASLHSYRDAVHYLEEVDEIDESTREQLYSRTVRQVFRLKNIPAPTH